MILLYWLRGIFSSGRPAGATLEIFNAGTRARIFFAQNRQPIESIQRDESFQAEKRLSTFKSI